MQTIVKLIDAVLFVVLGLVIWELIDPGEMSGYVALLFRYFASFI